MSGAARYCAFQGDPSRKSDMVDRVRTKWTQGHAFPLAYLKWRTDGGMVSLSGTLAETQVPEQFIERTGLPIELATLCEGLVYAPSRMVRRWWRSKNWISPRVRACWCRERRARARARCCAASPGCGHMAAGRLTFPPTRRSPSCPSAITCPTARSPA